jgi:hypothetical protein
MVKYETTETTWSHTTDTDVTRSYIMIPASASARLAHDMMMGRSPEMKQLLVRSNIVQVFFSKETHAEKFSHIRQVSAETIQLR